MEYVPENSLYHLLKNVGPFNEDIGRFFLSQFIDVLTYMHDSVGVVHRDLKLENVMID